MKKAPPKRGFLFKVLRGRLVVARSGELKQRGEDIDEVEIEAQRAVDRLFAIVSESSAV